MRCAPGLVGGGQHLEPQLYDIAVGRGVFAEAAQGLVALNQDTVAIECHRYAIVMAEVAADAAGEEVEQPLQSARQRHCRARRRVDVTGGRSVRSEFSVHSAETIMRGALLQACF